MSSSSESIEKRNTLIYYFVCVPIRCCISAFAYYYLSKRFQDDPDDVKYALGRGAFIVGGVVASIGFMVNYLNNKDKGAFGGEAWWNPIRPVHAVMWLLISILSYMNQMKTVGILVMIDLMVGVVYKSVHSWS